MNTRDIRTSWDAAMCDVCGRTLLRGERADVYLNGATRRSVCELCKSRAVHEGWVREGTVPAYDGGDDGSDRRRSLLGRLRQRKDVGTGDVAPTLADDLDAQAWSESAEGISLEPVEPDDLPPRAAEPPRNRRRREPRGTREIRQARDPRAPREPRHVRAVPSSDDQKILAAANLFNGSEHRRTVSGVARSLGEPSVTITPVAERPSLVSVVISWELCWYRYEVDLSDDEPAVRVSGQGYELGELDPGERVPNALASESGVLSLPGH